MNKIEIGALNFSYPMPTLLVGAIVGGKPNFITVSFCTAVQMKPPVLAISLSKKRYTNAGIKENGTFSVCVPSTDLLGAADYCGIYSGKEADKSDIFEIFYGKLETAPMIKNCPICIECKLINVIDILAEDEIFLGDVVETYTEEQYLTNGVPDLLKVKPFLLSVRDKSYLSIGEKIGTSWEAGKKYK